MSKTDDTDNKYANLFENSLEDGYEKYTEPKIIDF